LITGLNNLGPSLPVISDSSKKGKAVDLFAASSPKTNRKDNSGADSFKNVLKEKSADQKEVTAQKDTLFSHEDDVAVKTEPRMAPEDTNSRDEIDTVREKKRVGKEKADSDSSDREKVMLKFMDSMESEFGVPPQRIAEAMAKLPEDELEGSAEDSAPQVISQLNLKPEDQQKALLMYMSFLQKLNTADASKDVAPNPIANASAKATLVGAAAVQPNVASSISSQDKRMQLNQSLDQLNNKFFMKAERQEAFQQDGQPMMTSQSAMEMSGSLKDSARAPLTQQNLQGGQFDPQKLGLQPVQPHAYNAQSAKAQEVSQADVDRSALAQKLAALGAAAGALDKGLKADPQNLQALKAEQALQQMQGQQTPHQNLMGAMAVTGAGKAAGSQGDENLDDDGSSSGQGKDPFSASSISAAGMSHVTGGKDLPSALPATFAGAMGAAQGQQTAENNPNIRQIMTQAKYMIAKGGGESKIQLNPEGLGEIHMKVSVKDGKVDLQIATQTHEAKKLVESSMHELRDSLSQKSLGMDAVKVDVGNHLAGDKHHSDQQTQDQSQQKQFDLKQDLSRDQSRSQTRDFWSQFNDDGGFSRRAAMLDSPGIRAYGGGRRTEPLQPADTSRTSTEGRYVQSGKGRGIDLVA